MPLMLVSVTSFWFIFKVLENNSWKTYLFFGFCLGLTVGIKYNGFFIIAPFLLAHFLKNRVSFRSIFELKLVGAAIVAACAFFLVNPYSLLDYPSFHRDLFGMHEFETYVGFKHHFFYSLLGSLGLPLLFASCAGLVLILFKREQKKVVLGTYVLIYYLVLCFFSQQCDRYVLPLIPWMLFFAADALVFLRRTIAYPTILQGIFAFLILLPSLAKTILCDQLLSAPDVRTISTEWIEKNIPSNSRIAIDLPFFSPRLQANLKQLTGKRAELELDGKRAGLQVKRLDWMIDNVKKANAEKRRYELFFLSKHPEGEAFLFAKPVLSYGFKEVKKAGAQYVVMTRTRPIFFNSDYHSFYEQVKSNSDLIARFSPYKDKTRTWAIDDFPLTGAPFLWRELLGRESNGHIVEIYKLKQ
jgi:hypothetical protein